MMTLVKFYHSTWPVRSNFFPEPLPPLPRGAVVPDSGQDKGGRNIPASFVLCRGLWSVSRRVSL